MDRPPPNRLPRRTGSGRFPIKVNIPSTTTSPGDAQLSASSISTQKQTPPIPTRSHHRLDSQHIPPTPYTPLVQQNGSLSRPAVTPLILGNERLRSNSEGRVPGVRAKRMGMVSRKMSELGTVNENHANRLSHYRGLSHGSVMQGKRTTNGPAVAANGDSSSSPVSPVEKERRRGYSARRLSSLPEHKVESHSPDKLIEGIKGILYALDLVHPHIASLVSVIRHGSSRRTSLERVFYDATGYIRRLDREIHQLNAFAKEDYHPSPSDTEAIERACLMCVMAYQHVAGLLSDNARQVVMDGDARYVRTLTLFIYGGLVELRNGCINLGVDYDAWKLAIEEGMHDRAITPTQAQPRPGLRSRAETVIKRPVNLNSQPYVPPPASARSNASSRAGSLSSAAMTTPRSGESFPIPPTPMDFSSRFNTTKIVDDLKEERVFERIFYKLSHADDIALRIIPTVKQQFVRCIEVCEKQETEKSLRSMWTSLDSKCSFIIQLAELLKSKLTTIKLKEPGFLHDREFWQLCGSFVKTFVDTAMLVKDAKALELIPTDIVALMRPASKTIKELGMLIDNSPWGHLAASLPAFHRRVQLPQAVPTNVPSNNGQVSLSGHTSHHSGPNSSPYVSPVPATPLSAALGPAAQATIPSSVPAAPRNGVFTGNVFERAESLLSMPSRSMPSTMSYAHGHNPNIISPLGARVHPRNA
ncbi:MAG: RAM signaling network component [Peltula sp. TS41687]|nr:MAG: RAM signaling network component [Peltula sp. TS41687]